MELMELPNYRASFLLQHLRDVSYFTARPSIVPGGSSPGFLVTGRSVKFILPARGFTFPKDIQGEAAAQSRKALAISHDG